MLEVMQEGHVCRGGECDCAVWACRNGPSQSGDAHMLYGNRPQFHLSHDSQDQGAAPSAAMALGYHLLCSTADPDQLHMLRKVGIGQCRVSRRSSFHPAGKLCDWIPILSRIPIS
jgi:hypothetical protein